MPVKQQPTSLEKALPQADQAVFIAAVREDPEGKPALVCTRASDDA